MTNSTLRLNATAASPVESQKSITSYRDLVLHMLRADGFHPELGEPYDTNVRKLIENEDGSITIETYPPDRHSPENPPRWGAPENLSLREESKGRRLNPVHRFNITLNEPEYNEEEHRSIERFVNIYLMRSLKQTQDILANNRVTTWPHREAEKQYIDYMREKLLSEQAKLARRAQTVIDVATESVKRNA
jgi:hypothetical protein